MSTFGLIRPLGVDQAARYQIVVQGKLDRTWSEHFGGMDISQRKVLGMGTVTILQGVVTDQARLFGILNSLRDLGLPLLRVECLNPVRLSDAAE